MLCECQRLSAITTIPGITLTFDPVNVIDFSRSSGAEGMIALSSAIELAYRTSRGPIAPEI